MQINLESERIYVGKISSYISSQNNAGRDIGDIGGYVLYQERPVSLRGKPEGKDILQHGMGRSTVVDYLRRVGSFVKDIEVVDGVPTELLSHIGVGFTCRSLGDAEFRSILSDANLAEVKTLNETRERVAALDGLVVRASAA